VITPAMVTGFSFAEDFASQNTRVLADGSYLDPTSKFAANQHEISASSMRFGYPADQNNILNNTDTTKRYPEDILIYPEEYFKGPVVSRPKAPSYFLTLEQLSIYRKEENKKLGKDRGKASVNNSTPLEKKKDEDDYKVSAKKWRQQLLYGFSKSYYLESKYGARGGNIDLAFNPYLVPGMTFTMLDNNDFDKFHLTGLVTNVSISMSNANVSTSMSYTAGRTLKEVYEQVFTENTFGPDVGITDRRTSTPDIVDIYTTAPILPVVSLANQLQVDANAAEYYAELLYSKDKVGDTKKRPMVFRHSNFFSSTSGATIVKENSGLDSKVKGKLSGKTFPGTIKKVKVDPVGQTITQFNLDLQIKESEIFNINNYEVSMQRASRPICTLEEYKNMLNTPDQISELNKKEEEVDSEFGVPYPVQIRVYVVNTDELGDNFIRPYARPKSKLSIESAELRRDWPTKLLEYRARIKANAILGK